MSRQSRRYASPPDTASPRPSYQASTAGWVATALRTAWMAGNLSKTLGATPSKKPEPRKPSCPKKYRDSQGAAHRVAAARAVRGAEGLDLREERRDGAARLGRLSARRLLRLLLQPLPHRVQLALHVVDGVAQLVAARGGQRVGGVQARRLADEAHDGALLAEVPPVRQRQHGQRAPRRAGLQLAPLGEGDAVVLCG